MVINKLLGNQKITVTWVWRHYAIVGNDRDLDSNLLLFYLLSWNCGTWAIFWGPWLRIWTKSFKNFCTQKPILSCVKQFTLSGCEYNVATRKPICSRLLRYEISFMTLFSKATFTRDRTCSDQFGIGSTLFPRDRF